MIHSNEKSHRVKTSPMKNSEYNVLDGEKKILVRKLLYLFTYYSALASRFSYYQLTQTSFLKMISDTWSISGKPKQKNISVKLQVIYHSKGYKNSLQFNQFLQLLPIIAFHFNDDLHRQDAMKALLHYLLLLYNKTVLAQLSGKLIDFQVHFNQDTHNFLLKLVPDLTKIYKIYFPNEISLKTTKKDYRQLSFDNFLSIMKDFQVFPKLITTRDLFYIFHQVCNNRMNNFFKYNQQKGIFQEIGQFFRLSKFIQSLIVISKVTIGKLKKIQNQQQIDIKQKQTVKSLLEYMETVKTLRKIKSKYSTQRFSLVVLDDYLQEKQYKNITIKDRFIRQPVEKMRFYNMLSKLQF